MTQTFLPFDNFCRIAECLDNRRLNKQITEAKQVYTQNRYGFGGQGNPKPYKMWKGYEFTLIHYGLELYSEWQGRFDDGLRGGNRIHKCGEYFLIEFEKFRMNERWVKPSWFEDERLYSSHRSVLLAKDYDWYSQWGWAETPAIPVKIVRKNITWPYYWPEDKQS